MKESQLRGFLYCLASSLFYSVSLSLLRLMTNYRGVSQYWSLGVKEAVTFVVVGLFVLIQTLRGRYRFPSLRAIGIVLLAGVFCELVGANAHLWSYALIGIVLAAPLIQAFQLIGTAAIDATFLREPLSRIKLVAMSVLLVAVVLLSLSPILSTQPAPTPPTISVEAASATNPIDSPTAPITRDDSFTLPHGWPLFLGTLATLLAGIGYALHLTMIRGVVRDTPKKTPHSPKNANPMPISLVMVLVTGIGAISFLAFFVSEKGFSGFSEIPRECWPIILASGFLNLVGYFFQNVGVRLVSASKLALIAVSQIFLLTVFGIVFFHEPSGIFVWIGFFLTVLGVTLAGFSR